MNFSKITLCSKGLFSLLFILAISVTLQAQDNDYAVELDATTLELVEHLNTSTVNPDNVSDQVSLAKVNLEKRYKDGTYNEEVYDQLLFRLLEVEEILHQAAIDKRLNDAKNQSVQKPKVIDRSDTSKAKAILKKKLESGAIDNITYMKRMRLLEEKSGSGN